MTPTRTFFMGATQKPCMGAPTPAPSPHIADLRLMQPAAIAAAPIQAAPVKNSRLFWFMIEVVLFCVVYFNIKTPP
jgi:hypothetical protein